MTALRIWLLSSVLLFACCNESEKKVPGSPLDLPANAETVPVQITELNCWQERGNFYVTGICNSQSNQWQRIWLRMEPIDGNGKPLLISGVPGADFPVFSTAIPPRGRSAFFYGWPISAFSKAPDSCRITGARGLKLEAGPVLIAENTSSLRMQTLSQPDNPNSEKLEQGWQVSTVLSNPLAYTALRPFVEMLVYGQDNRLWFATKIDTEDPGLQNIVQMERKGPMAPGAKRSFATQVTYGNLPEALKMNKIGKIEVLAFENR